MSEWKEVKLGDVIQLSTNKVESKKMSLERYVSTDNLLPNLGGIELAKSLPKQPKYTSFQKGDVLFSNIRTYFKKVWKADFDGGCSNDVLVFKSINNNEVDQAFVYYVISNSVFVDYTAFTAKGTKMPRGDKEAIKNYSLLLPGITEQIEITKTLSNLDKKITLLRQQNQDLEELAQTIFKRWFVEFEFPNENGEPYKSSGGKMVESELGEIPEGWRVGCLGDEFTILMGQSPSGSSYNDIKEGKVFYQGRTDFGFRFPTNRLYTTEPKRMADEFDVLVSVRAPVGDVNMASEKCCIGRGLGAVKSDLKSYCFNKIKSMKKAFDVFENEGTVFGSLSKNDFNSLEVIIPDKQITEKYDQAGLKMDLKILGNSNEIQTLTQLRDTLLPKLMSGELKVDN